MMKLRSCVIAATLCVAGIGAAGCQEQQGSDVPDVVQSKKKPAAMRGQVRLGDKWLKIQPIVVHEPRMDLRVACLTQADNAKKAGKDAAPLCFTNSFREASEVALIRVEVMHGKGTPLQTRAMLAAGEAAHFTIDTTGTPYQMLDLGYAPRRDGAYQPGEIRVLSADDAVHSVLLDELKRLFPAAKIQIVTKANDAAHPSVNPAKLP